MATRVDATCRVCLALAIAALFGPALPAQERQQSHTLFTVATLPTCNASRKGHTHEVSDATSSTVLGVGGGTKGAHAACREDPPATFAWTAVDTSAAGANSFGVIGVATADSSGDTLSVTDSLSVDLTTTNDPEDLTGAWRYDQTLAGNPALNAEECIATTDGTASGGLLCEGTTANTNEQLYLIPASDAADTTNFFALGASDGDALAGASATSFFDAGAVEAVRIDTAIARLASPALTGDPTAPTAAIDDSDTSISSTAFVQQEINGAGGTDLTCATGTCDVDAAVARLASPVLTGDPTGPTPPVNDNDTSLATTAYVQSETVAAGDISGTLSGGFTVDADAIAAPELSNTAALSGDHAFAANEQQFGQSGLIFEGATANLLESYISVVDPTVDRTMTIPDANTAPGQAVTCSGSDKVSAFNATTGAFTCTADVSGGSPTLDSIVDPVAVTSLVMNATAETITFDFQAAFAADQFSIRQTTGNPTAGTLFDVRAADTDVVIFRGGDGTNGITLSQAGALTVEGSGAITATLGDNATAFFVTGAVEEARIDTALARLASPALTGNPTGPTAAVNDNDTSLATTAFVQAETVAAGDVSGTLSGGFTVDANAIGASELDEGATFTFTGTLDASGATRTAPRGVSTTPPATCTIGDEWFDTDATAGQREHSCDPANTWTAHGDGVGLGGWEETGSDPNIDFGPDAANTAGGLVLNDPVFPNTNIRSDVSTNTGLIVGRVAGVPVEWIASGSRVGFISGATSTFSLELTAMSEFAADGAPRVTFATNGSCALPVYNFLGDFDTGLWRPAVDQVEWCLGAEPRFRLFDSGDVSSHKTTTFFGPTRATSADDDEAFISFSLDVDDGQEEMARIAVIAEDVTTATEDGGIGFSTRSGGAAIEERVTILSTGNLRLEGLTADAFETTVSITDPTALRTLSIPDADTAPGQAVTCGSTDKVSAFNATTGVFTCTADQDSGGAPAWEALVNSADTATAYTSNNVAETVTFLFESAFTADQMLIHQQTGNPTSGTLLDLRAADTDVVVLRAGDGTNGITLSQAGALTVDGTGTIVATSGDSGTGFFSSGAVEAAFIDAAIARLASPIFTGDPTAPTAAANDDDTSLATTAYVQQELNGAGGTDLTCATGTCNVDAAVARLASPIFTGDPTAPTPAANDNDTSVPTTAYVQTELTAYASDTVTFTNKTLDGEATGNAITITWEVYLDAAACAGAAATNNWDDSPTLAEPAAACLTATNVTKGVSNFDAATDEGYQRKFRLPDGFTGAIDAEFIWNSADTGATESVVWSIETLCVADAETYAGTFNTADTVTDDTKTTARQRNVASISGIDTTGCAAAEDIIFEVSRDADVAGDDAPSDASLIAVWIKGRRTI